MSNSPADPHQQLQSRLKATANDINHRNVSKLYDLCIRTLINHNLNLIISKNERGIELKLKLPSTICDSILAEYLNYYESKVKTLERNEYFLLNKCIRQNKRVKSPAAGQLVVDDAVVEATADYELIAGYDLLKCFAAQSGISTAVYKQCMRTSTPLNERIRKLVKNDKKPPSDRLLKVLNLRSSNNPKHLNDADIEMLCTNKIEYMDICPCLLTNRVVALINTNLKGLKYLKLQNYCDWSVTNSEGECGRLFKKATDNTSDGKFNDVHEDIDIDDEDDDDDDDEDFDFIDGQCAASASVANNIEMSDSIDFIDGIDEDGNDLSQQLKAKGENKQLAGSSSSSNSSAGSNRNTSFSRLLRQYPFLRTRSSEMCQEDDSRQQRDDNGLTANLQELLRSILNRRLFRSGNETAATDEMDNVKKKKKLKKTAAAAAAVAATSSQSSTTSNLLSLLPLWMSKHIDLMNKSNNEETAASTSAATTSNQADLYENLNDFFLNEQKSTYMNEEEVAKYLLNLELLANDGDTDDEDEDDDDDYYSDSDRQLDKQLRYLDDDEEDDEEFNVDNKIYLKKAKPCEQLAILSLENLQYLSLKGLDNCLTVNVLNDVLSKFKQLKYLDLTNCFKSTATTAGTGITGDHLSPKENLASSLRHLIFSNFNPDELILNIKFITSLRQLSYLDLSNYRDKNLLNMYKNSSYLLAKLVFCLKNLHSIDISGTNLGGPDIFKLEDEIKYIKAKLAFDLHQEIDDVEFKQERLDFLKKLTSQNCTQSKIIGLLFLNCKKLNFLGCLNCDQRVSTRDNIPAVHIAGESKEQYLFTCLEVYLDKPLFILDSLNHLFELYRDDVIVDKLYGGHLIMNCMQKYINNSRIQISGSASLFYVLKYSKDENKQLPYFYLKRLIDTIINAIEEHLDENAMRRNCVLIMCRLNLPDDVLFVSDRLIHILLKIFDDYIEERTKLLDRSNSSMDRSDSFILRTAMHLLNILACSVHGSDKTSVGALAIPVAMELINTKIEQGDLDDILEVTWSFLWNITDETPENCQIFLDSCDGMKIFMKCIEYKRPEIVRNMMGLLGNVAEVKRLRDRLVRNEYIAKFRELLFNNKEGIEIPYNSAGVLAHIMSDDAGIWNTCDAHSRDDVIKDLETAIDKWDINSERNINYRSFEPIFRLVTENSNPICQRWSCWALANLTTVYPDTYCPLFVKENGHVLLKPLCENENVNTTIRNYANIVLNNVLKFGCVI